MEIDTETSHEGFDDLLAAVLSGDKPIACVLDHPEFRKRALRICQRIASVSDVDHLFQDACLRILTHKSIHRSHLQSSATFLHWFYKLVSQVNGTKVPNMRTCADQNGQWPDKSADVAPDTMNEFYRHAEECLFHKEVIRAEEEELERKLTSIVGLARGFDKQGQILTGPELQAARLEHERRMKTWNDAVLKKDYPFRQLSLCNGPREIARCGIFFDLIIHESLHELDIKSGLQIRGIGRINTDDDVLLGFYPLEGFRHDGDEKTLALGNGYTVGLRIRKSAGTKYWINFRCVESEVLAAELEDNNGNDVGENLELIDDGAPCDRAIDNNGSFVLSEQEITDAVGPLSMSTASRWRAIALAAMVLVVVGFPVSFAYGVRFKAQEVAAENEQEFDALLVMNQRLDELDYRFAYSTKALKNMESKLQEEKQKTSTQEQQLKRLGARLHQEQANNQATLRENLKTLDEALHRYKLLLALRQDVSHPALDQTEALERLEWMRALALNQRGSSYIDRSERQIAAPTPYALNMEMIRFRLNDDGRTVEPNPPLPLWYRSGRQTWRYQVSVSHPDSANDRVAIFVGSSPELKKELLRLSNLSVEPVRPGSPLSAFKVIWNVTKEWGKIVEIQATVLHDDEFYEEFVFQTGPGTVVTEGCSDLACRKLLVQAVATVYQYINPTWRNHLDAGTVPQLPRGVRLQEKPVTPRDEEKTKQRDEKSRPGKGAHAK